MHMYICVSLLYPMDPCSMMNFDFELSSRDAKKTGGTERGCRDGKLVTRHCL